MVDKTRKKTTHYIHRTSYRFQEKIAGIFVLAAVGLLLVMLFSQIKSQDIFEEYFTIYGRLKSAEGIGRETIIQVSGFQVGQVAAIEITEQNDILLTMNIIRRYHRLLREDSKIKVRGLSATIIGKSVIELTAGSPELALIQEGVTLEIKESLSVETITAEATKTLKTIDAVINNVAQVVSAVDPEKLASTLDGLKEMAQNFSEISAQMKSVDGPFGALVYDLQTAQNIKRGVSNLDKSTEKLFTSVENIEQSTKNIQVLTTNFQKTSENFDQFLDNLNINLKKVPALLEGINEVVNEAQHTVKATQRVWPISTTIKSPDTLPTTIKPIPASD